MTPGTDSGLLAPVWAGSAAPVADEAWLAAMIEVEIALARAQAEVGMISAEAAAFIATVTVADLDLPEIAERARGAGNPVVVFVELFTAAVAARDAGAAEFVHRGGTSQDILDSAAMVVSDRACAAIENDLVRTAAALAEHARRHRDTPMAGRTLAQHAVPITFGLKAAGWLELVLIALGRVRELRADGLPAQLGGAAGTLASYQEYGADALALSAAFARALNRPEPLVPWHSLRTPIADLGSVLGYVSGALGKFAVDVRLASRTEIGEISEPAADGRGVSSAMPQKRNPVLATLIISAARQVPAQAQILAQSLLGEDERSAGEWHAEWQPLRECLRLVMGAAHTAAELAEGMTVHPDRLAANLALTGSSIVSERLNVVLADTLGKAPAKKRLAALARDAAAGDRSFAELLAADPATGPALGGRITELGDPAAYLGVSGALVDRVLTAYAGGAVCRARRAR